MTEADIKERIAAIESKLVETSAKRDDLAAFARQLSSERAELESLLKIHALPESNLKATILDAIGIPSAEHVNGQ